MKSVKHLQLLLPKASQSEAYASQSTFIHQQSLVRQA